MPSPQELGVPSPEKTVEGRFRLFAERQKKRMLAGEKRGVALLIKEENYEELQNAKPLFEGPRRRSDVKVKPIGEILYTTWRVREVVPTEGGWLVLKESKRKKEPPSYIILWPRRPRYDYQVRLPEDTKVVELLVHHPENIEEAIAEVKDILGVAVMTEAMDIVGFAQKQARDFLMGRITEEKLEKLAKRTTDFLTDKGLLKLTSPERKKMVERLKKACERDSRGRINPLASRVRLGSAYYYGVRRAMEAYLIRKKHGSSLEDLVYERVFTLWAIITATRQLKIFTGHVAFRKPEAKITDLQIEAMVKVLESIVYETLTIPRVQDYLAPARAAAINLVGCREEKREENRQIIGDELADLFFGMRTVPELLRQRQFEEAKYRIKGSYECLKLVLADHASENVP
ncbi:MAG: hypothetical protein LiPW16_494 [Microgenomates group bacterium LiPW_16]|nr:MAG: hypothetical protein LiPW16_494 [Microgenomates group bacterium LiPW_16]